MSSTGCLVEGKRRVLGIWCLSVIGPSGAALKCLHIYILKKKSNWFHFPFFFLIYPSIYFPYCLTSSGCRVGYTMDWLPAKHKGAQPCTSHLWEHSCQCDARHTPSFILRYDCDMSHQRCCVMILNSKFHKGWCFVRRSLPIVLLSFNNNVYGPMWPALMFTHENMSHITKTKLKKNRGQQKKFQPFLYSRFYKCVILTRNIRGG